MKKTINLSLQEAREIYKQGNNTMNTLLLANFTKEELEEKELPKRWENINTIGGFYVSFESMILHAIEAPTAEINVNIFKTEKQAKSALAMAQLSQLMHVYNDGKEIDWSDDTMKYTIDRRVDSIIPFENFHYYNFLAFHSRERRDLFLKNFEHLIREYFMLD